MAENPHLTLTINGSKVQGESTQFPKDGAIELSSVSFGLTSPTDPQTGAATGRRTYSPILITKRVDKCSPLLMKALCMNEKVKGVIKFYRPPVDGKKASEHFYTVEFDEGRVESVSQIGSAMIPTETVSFQFRMITCTFEKGGVTHSDDWAVS